MKSESIIRSVEHGSGIMAGLSLSRERPFSVITFAAAWLDIVLTFAVLYQHSLSP